MNFKCFRFIQQIPRESWNSLVPPGFPFARHEFLGALEETGCLGERTGWEPLYLVLQENGEILGAMALYIKDNSYGEYIFDFGWAHVHQNTGRSYYPKLVCAIPFTPATGPKLLLKSSLPEEKRVRVATFLLSEVSRLGIQLDVSSWHSLFISQDEIPYYQNAGWMIRHSYQYHWRNSGFTTFQDFLGTLRSKRRKEIVRERAQVSGQGVRIERLTGDQLIPEHAEIMHGFYLSTIRKMGGFNYLTVDFFKRVFAELKAQILFVLATDALGDPVAGAMNFFGGTTLFGRHWGCLDEYKALHFELCYYQGIEFAIERKLGLFEAGAQGEHKFQRGFLPTLTYSAHHIPDPEMKILIRDFIEREKLQIRNLFVEYMEHSPFSQGDSLRNI